MATTLPPKVVASLNKDPADPKAHIDWAILGIVAALCAVGIGAIYSARFSALSLAGQDTLYFVRRQGMGIAAGAVGMVVMMLVDYHKLRDVAVLAYLGALSLLGLVLVAGQEVNGARAWFVIGGFQLQPAELAKIVVIVALAAYLSADRPEGPLPSHRFVIALLLTGILIAPIMLQPDLGSASVFVVVMMAVVLAAGAHWRNIAIVSLLAVATVVAVVGTGMLDQYQKDRLTAFVQQDPTQANRNLLLQTRNSKAAIAQGGVFGEGWLEGTLTNGGYVPENHTDFVFSAISEQFGLAGAGLVLALYALLAVRIWRVAKMAADSFGTLLCCGVLALLAWHVFENVGMTMGIMPVTGIPLPLISYGGSSTAAFLVLIGIVESVHMRRFA